MTEEKKENEQPKEQEDLVVVPLNIILGELERVKFALQQYIITLNVTEGEAKEDAKEDKDSQAS